MSALIRNALISFRLLWIHAFVAMTRAGRQRLAEAEKMVVFDPGIRGGIPTIKGTRIGVYEAADFAKMEGMDVTLESYPTLNREMVELALLYDKAHPLVGCRAYKRHNIPGRRLKYSYRVSLND